MGVRIPPVPLTTRSTGRLAAKTPLSYSGYVGSSPTRCSTQRSALPFFDNLNALLCAHDVVAAFLLAMQGVSVRFRLGALRFRAWESLAIRRFREPEIAGSSPAVLTDAVGPVLVREGDC